MTNTYEAKQDNVGALVPVKNARRCLVIKYHNGAFAYVCGAFSTMKAAEQRAASLNAEEVAQLDDQINDPNWVGSRWHY